MCLAVTARITKINGSTAKADFGGVSSEIDVRLLKRPRKGDYVLVHAGYAIEKVKSGYVKELRAILKSSHAKT